MGRTLVCRLSESIKGETATGISEREKVGINFSRHTPNKTIIRRLACGTPLQYGSLSHIRDTFVVAIKHTVYSLPGFYR
jgi:hypothetical protein